MADFSWSDSLYAVFGSCLACLKDTPSPDAEHEHDYHPDGSRIPRARADELEGLLADADDAETLSLHSNIGDRDGRRRKRRKPRKGIRLFGYELFGRPPIHLTDDEDDDSERSAGRRSRVNRDDGRTTSSSTLDSDASPLDPSTIDQFSAARIRERAALEEQERREKADRKKQRKERKDLKRAAMALAMGGDQDEFEGFPGSGNSYSHVPSPFRTSSEPHSPPLAEDFGPFEQAQPSHEPNSDEPDVDGADFGAEPYTRRTPNGGASTSTGTGSDSRSRTSGSGSTSNASTSRYNHHYLSQQPQPQHPADPSSSLPPTSTPLDLSLPTTEAPRKKKKKKSSSSSSKPRSASSKQSTSSTSQDTSLASPPPQHAVFEAFAPVPEIASEGFVRDEGRFDGAGGGGFPSVGFSRGAVGGGVRRKNSEAGVFLARRGDD